MPSTVIHAFSYKPDERRLEVLFTSGRAYSYHDVPAEVFERMARSFAKGEFFNRQIRGRYRFARLHGPDPA
jgi:lysyl-tRNA synthetase class 2